MMRTNLVLFLAFFFSGKLYNGKVRRKTKKTSEATIIFAGDITFDGPVKYFAEVAKTCDYKKPFDKIIKEMKDADLRVVNLESPLMDAKSDTTKLYPGKNIHHRGHENATVGLKYAGFDVIQLANNHMADYGSKGIKNTIETLQRYGIGYIGVSHGTRQKAFVKTINGVKIGMLAYCWNYEGCTSLKCRPGDLCDSDAKMVRIGPAVFVKKVALKEIKILRNEVDIVVVLMHWGKEKTVIPALRTRRAANEMKIAGANIIIGTHPHVIQGHECIGPNTLVVYSLGNFLLPMDGSITGNFLTDRNVSKMDVKEYTRKMKEVFNLSQQAYIVKIKVNRLAIISADYLPIEIRNQKGSNCLQTIPRGKWQSICTMDDIYCYDYRDFYANSPMVNEEQMIKTPVPKRFCINKAN